MKNKLAVIICLAFLLGSLESQAKCKKSELDKISSELSVPDMTITKLEKVYGKITKCNAMDGEYAEGFNDEASKLLSSSWSDVLKAKELKNKEFRKALVKSLSDGSEKNAFEKACASAETCISEHPFCKEVKNQCEETRAWIKANIK